MLQSIGVDNQVKTAVRIWHRLHVEVRIIRQAVARHASKIWTERTRLVDLKHVDASDGHGINEFDERSSASCCSQQRFG
jgi:hypothetical protein